MPLLTSIKSYYKLDENTGTTAGDATGNGNTGTWNGTLGGVQWTTGKINSGGSFNGSDRYISAADPSVGAAFSVAMWVKPTGNLGSTGQGLFDTKPSVAGALRIYGSGGGALNYDTGGSALASYNIGDWTGQWHHLVLVLTSSNVTTLYVDGSNVASATNTQNGSSNAFQIGRYNSGNYFNGTIDEVGVWNKALTAAEVSFLYNAGFGVSFPFNEPSLIYKNQFRLERLAAKVTGVSGVAPRFSDLETPLFSQPGQSKRKSDEIAYYENKNGDGATINRKMSDAGSTFWEANGGAASRADEAEHVFYKNGSFI